MAITESGDPKTGMITLSGVPQPDLSGVEGDLTSLQSDVLDLQSNVGDLNVSVGTLDTRVAATEPTVTVTGSVAATANTWHTIWIKTLSQGLAGSIAIPNSIFWTGTAGTLTAAQIRFYNSYRRVTGGSAAVQAGSPGVQGSILSTSARLLASGNDILLQVQFGVTATINYRVPIYLEEIQL